MHKCPKGVALHAADDILDVDERPYVPPIARERHGECLASVCRGLLQERFEGWVAADDAIEHDDVGLINRTGDRREVRMPNVLFLGWQMSKVENILRSVATT